MRMAPGLLALIGTVALSASEAFAQTLATSNTPATPPQHTPIRKTGETERMRQARIQTFLARAGFSPGLIDGRPGRKTLMALEQYQKSRALPVTTTVAASHPALTLNDGTIEALAENDKLVRAESWTRHMLITNSDLSLVTGPIPEDWNERAKLTVSGYADLLELLAERNWCTPELIQVLNPGVDINALIAGDEVIVPDVQVKALPQVSRIEISLKEQIIRGFDSADQQVLLMHCSIARLPERRPVGTFHVQTVVSDPDYTFDPKDWPEVTNVMSKLRIAPGPRTPVGAAWIGLDKPSYGIHGTVRPQDIGKTGSHGCFRLCNWDATRLSKAVKIGTVVEIQE